MKAVGSAVLLTVTCQLAACDKLPFAPSKEESAAIVCEDKVKYNLVSPSSYKRVWYDYTARGPIIKEEFLEKAKAELDQARSRRIGEISTEKVIAGLGAAQVLSCNSGKKCDSNVFRYEHSGLSEKKNTGYVLIEYEAANAFGVSLPSYFGCRLTQLTGSTYESRNIYTADNIPRQLGDQTKELFEGMR